MSKFDGRFIDESSMNVIDVVRHLKIGEDWKTIYKNTPRLNTVWKNENFTHAEMIFRQINYLYFISNFII